MNAYSEVQIKERKKSRSVKVAPVFIDRDTCCGGFCACLNFCISNLAL